MDKLSEIFMMQQAFDTELVERRHLNGISMEEWMQKETRKWWMCSISSSACA